MFAPLSLSFCPPARVLVPFAMALAALLGSSCSVDSEPLFQPVEPLAPSAARPGNLPVFSGPAGAGLGATGAASDGLRGEAVQGLLGADAGMLDALSRGDAGADAGGECQRHVECEDGNECTLDECSSGVCRRSARPLDYACGNPQQDECTQPDRCDGAGRCLARHAVASTPCGRTAGGGCSADACDGAGACQAVDVAAGTPCGDDGGGCNAAVCDGAGACQPRAEPNGSACPGGSCSVGACVAGQPVGCPGELASTVPVLSSWSSAGLPSLIQGSCASLNTPDFALVFSAPSAGAYRIEASGTEDSVLVVHAGACGSADEIACNDDVNQNSRDSRIELALSAGQTITIYVSEFGDGSSGAGTLRITLL